MAGGRARRTREEGSVDDFLDAAVSSPVALLIEGEAGIGKTTLWLTTIQRARARDFRVLSTRATAAESVSAYSALTELLADVKPSTWARLTDPQRVAIDQILSRTGDLDTTTNQRAVAAAFLSIVEKLAEKGPTLLAVDDLQWLEPSSRHVLAYTARRLRGPVGVLGTVRSAGADTGDASWLQLLRPDAVDRIELRPMSVKELHGVVTSHLGAPLSTAAIRRIHQISGGNPFYAIELARAFDGTADTFLPSTLAEVVAARIDGLDRPVRDVLVAAAALAAPTVELTRAATGLDRDRLIELLEAAERDHIIAIEGNRIRFTHPLLATGVYTSSPVEHRRLLHHRIADLVDHPELRARHLALAVTSADEDTLRALDEAAHSAVRRGAPAAAAELLELAVSLGGDSPERKTRLAWHCFDAGNPQRAKALLNDAVAELPAGPTRAAALFQLALVRFIDDGYPDAVELLTRALADEPEPATRVRIRTALAHGLYNVGQHQAAQACAEEAVPEAERLGVPGLLSQALAVRSMLRFLLGEGFDEPSLQRAVALEDHQAATPTLLRPGVMYALQLGWIGDLDESHDRMLAIHHRCVERGEESDLLFMDFQMAMNRIFRGDYGAARRIIDEAVELARRLGGGFPQMTGSVLQATLAAYTAGTDEATSAIDTALDDAKRCGTRWHEDLSLSLLAFVQTSVRDYDAAVHTLEPLIARYSEAGIAEIPTAGFTPDAVEALVGVGRLDEAERLADALVGHGQRLGRAWASAVGGRARAMVLAARGDLDGALASATAAMTHHDRLPMPFERARTQLLLGQLQRRARDRTGAATVRAALAVFEQLGTPRWVDLARAELDDLADTANALATLTDAERRVAELAAEGRTNREVSEQLFISAKTVEATLARVYRKLGIRSRAELGQLMGGAGSERV